MFLIEFCKNEFVNAEKIDFLGMNDGKVVFNLSGETEGLYVVDKNLESSFLNNLQALNKNAMNVQSRYLQINDVAAKGEVNK